VSGRSAVIPRIDSAVGLYVNVLPVRVLVPPDGEVVPWLLDLQRQQTESLRYEFCSLVSIHKWSDVPRNQPLFESCTIFQNYPGVSVPESAGVDVVHIGVIERTNVPLTLIPNPAAQLDLKIVYMGSRFEDATIADMSEKLRRILQELTSNSRAPLSSISYQVAAERRQLIDSFNQSLASL
jgi:non-ribosomal peptide synthetase component F